MEVLRRAYQQKPNRDGVRKFRALVVRNTFSELKSTTIKTCEAWWSGLGRFVFDSPIRYEAKRVLPDGTVLDFECYFLPLDRADDVKKLKSLEVTVAWLNEASELDAGVLRMVRGRVGRYPSAIDGGATWSGIILDTNPPSGRSWFYELFEVERPEKHKIWHQPGGLIKLDDGTYIPNPRAENVDYLPGKFDYYFNQCAGADDNYINVMVLGNYGANFDGKPVYQHYSDEVHCASDPITLHQGGLVTIGMDFGLHPAAIFTQMTPTGRLDVADELCGKDVTFEEFLDTALIPLIQDKYQFYSIQAVGDPTGSSRSSLSNKTAFDMLRERGIAVVPAQSNDFIVRRDAVAHFLARRDGILISPTCTLLREGFQGGYRYTTVGGTADKFKLEPEKDEFSHPHDGLQYAALSYYRPQVQSRQTRINRILGEGARLRQKAPRKKFLYA